MKISLGVWLLCWTAILYTYLLFPILLALCARFRERTARAAQTPAELPCALSEALPDGEWPRIAMVVAAYNEIANLPAKLQNTWAVDYPADRLTLYIGSDGSEDGTDELLKSCEDDRLRANVFPLRRGKISVLNDLMSQVGQAEAEIVVMSDANTLYAPDALKQIARHFADPNVGCVSGELRLEQAGGVSGEGLYWRYECWIKRQESRLGFLIGCNGGIFALRKELYAPLPAWTIVEDFVISMRVLQQGRQVRYEPLARATEPPCDSSRAEMVRKIRIGAGNFQALLMTREMLHPRYGCQSFAFWGTQSDALAGSPVFCDRAWGEHRFGRPSAVPGDFGSAADRSGHRGVGLQCSVRRGDAPLDAPHQLLLPDELCPALRLHPHCAWQAKGDVGTRLASPQRAPCAGIRRPHEWPLRRRTGSSRGRRFAHSHR